MCVFEFTGTAAGRATCITIRMSGSTSSMVNSIFEVGDEAISPGRRRMRFHAAQGCPCVGHAASGKPGKIINVYQPAGKMEEFFREVSTFKDLPTREQVVNKTYTEEQVTACIGCLTPTGWTFSVRRQWVEERHAEPSPALRAPYPIGWERASG